MIDSADSFDAFLRLWICGNTVLNQKLSKGVAKLGLYTSMPSRLLKFPRSILSLRNLRSLTIESKFQIIKDPLEWRNIVPLLPPSLETLRLCFFGAYHALFDYAAHATKDNLQCIKRSYPLGQSRLIDFHALLPNLRTLDVDDKFGREFEPGDILALPPTLTSLRLSPFDGSANIKMAMLPRDLIRLGITLDLTNIDERVLQQDWALAPPNLQYVKHLSLRDAAANWLPASLTEASIHGDENFRYIRDPSLDLIRSFYAI